MKTTNSELPKRKSIRLAQYDYSSPGVYFLTICTEQRKNYFWVGELDLKVFDWHLVGANCVRPQNLPLSTIGKIVYEALEKWNDTYDTVTLPAFVIMPNHLHTSLLKTKKRARRLAFLFSGDYSATKIKG